MEMPKPVATPEERQAEMAAERERIERMFAALESKIKRVRPSLLYRIQLLLTALVMAMLPLVYLAMIGAALYGVYYHATVNFTILESRGDVRGRAIAYLAPIVAGLAVVAALVKPLLARPAAGISPRPLKREDEPMLFEFVDRLCKCVRAPRPSRIQVDCEVNAAASPRRGLFSLLTGNLTLTVGLPLVQGLTLRQFAGVLAHEFGHFGQGGAMTLCYLIRRVNGWFAQVVYGEDTWDVWLASVGRHGLAGILIAMVTRLCIWLVKCILFCLMWFGHFISCGMMRQMEYDADRYEARVAGEGAFEQTMRRILLMDGAWRMTQGDLSQAWEEKRLGDHLPALIENNCDRMPEPARIAFVKAAFEAKTRMFDTHPSPAARVRRAAREKGEGILNDDGPASILFRRYDALCKTVTMDFYAGRLGPRIAEAKLVPTAELIGRREAIDAEQDVAKRFTGGVLLFPVTVVPETTELGPPADPKAVLLELKSQLKMTGDAAPPMREAMGRYAEAGMMQLEATVAESLLEAKVGFKAAAFGMAKRNKDEARRRGDKGTRLREDALMEIHPVVYAVRRRLFCALRLLYTPQVRARLEAPDRMTRDAEELVRSLRTLDSIEPSIHGLRGTLKALETLLRSLKGNEKSEPFISQVLLQARRGQEQLARIRDAFNWIDYPFEHGAGKISLGEFMIPTVPDRKEVGDVMNASEQAIDRLERFYFRANGAVMKIAGQVEAAIGLGMPAAAARNEAASQPESQPESQPAAEAAEAAVSIATTAERAMEAAMEGPPEIEPARPEFEAPIALPIAPANEGIVAGPSGDLVIEPMAAGRATEPIRAANGEPSAEEPEAVGLAAIDSDSTNRPSVATVARPRYQPLKSFRE
jgi:Zn-dependent protease with chaperone function